MEQRISDFMDIRRQLVEASHFCLYRVNDNDDWGGIYEKMSLHKTRLNEAVKNLSADELSEIIRTDLQACFDLKTAKPLSWICGLDLKELPMSISFIGSSLGVEYSPDVRIGIGTNAEGLYFSVETAEGLWHSDSFDLHNMEETFLRALKHVEEKVLGEDANTKNNEIKDLKERLTKVNHIFLHQEDADWDSVTEEFFLLKARMEEVLKTLSVDEFDEIVLKDFQACVDRKTAEPLLWMCGIDVSELPMHADMWMDYAPDVDIGLVTRLNEADRDVLCFSVRTYGLAVHWDFNLFDIEESLLHALETAEAYKEAYLDENKEDPTDEELEDEDHDDR